TRWQYFHGLGITLSLAGDLDGSAEALQHGLALAPNEPILLQALAQTRSRQGRSADAIQCWRAALTADPESAEAHNSLGTALVRNGEIEEAAKALREAVRLRPEVAAIRVNLAELLA